MELLQGLDLSTMGFVALATFGAVAAVNFKWRLTSMQNFWLSVAFAFGFGFVPGDWGSFFANKIKEAVAIATTLNGAYQFLSGLAKKVNG